MTESVMDLRQKLFLQQILLRNLKVGVVRKIGFRVAVSGAIACLIYTLDYSGTQSTANSPVEASDRVSIPSDRGSIESAELRKNGSEENLLAVMQGPPAPQPVNTAKPAAPTKPAAPRISAKPAKRPAIAAMPAGVERFDLCSTRCETRDPLIVGSSETIQPAPVLASAVSSSSESNALSLGSSALRGGREILERAVDASDAALNKGKQALYSAVNVVW
jgi:hypothetical protein